MTGWLEGREGLERLFLASPHPDFSQPGVCVSPSLWVSPFLFLLRSPCSYCITSLLSERLCGGDLTSGQAEPQPVRPPRGEGMGLTGWAERETPSTPIPAGF